MRRLWELEEEENRRLKKRYAEERLKAEIVSEALTKKCQGHLDAARWPCKRLRGAACAALSVSETCYRYEP